MSYCSKCGASIEAKAAFCSGCGASLKPSAARPAGFWKGVVAAIVGVGALVGLFWITMGANSADHRAGDAGDGDHPAASAAEPEHVERAEASESEDVVVEEPGFVGRLLGEKPRVFVTVPQGESLALALSEPISTETAETGDGFTAVLTKPVRVEQMDALPKGTPVTGHVSHAAHSDKVKGRAQLTLELDALELPSGEQYRFEAEPLRFEAHSTKKDDALKIGGGAGVGALVGGILGGKKGAAIGAGVGAGAGTGVVLTTRGDEVVLPEGTALATVLRSDVRVEIVEDEES